MQSVRLYSAKLEMINNFMNITLSDDINMCWLLCLSQAHCRTRSPLEEMVYVLQAKGRTMPQKAGTSITTDGKYKVCVC